MTPLACPLFSVTLPNAADHRRQVMVQSVAALAPWPATACCPTGVGEGDPDLGASFATMRLGAPVPLQPLIHRVSLHLSRTILD